MAKKKQIQQSKQLDTGVYQLDKNTEIVENSKSKVVYTLFGSHDKLRNGYPLLSNADTSKDKLAYAIAETNNEKVTYFVKIDDQNNLFNPINIAPSQTSAVFKIMKDNKNWQFQKTNEKCFNQYIEFLKTKNILYLKFAEQLR